MTTTNDLTAIEGIDINCSYEMICIDRLNTKVNTIDTSGLQTQITANTNDISSLQSQTTTNTTNISTNTANISSLTLSTNKLNLYTSATDTNVINVKASPYNAVGDGVADDTTAINNAITALPANNGILFFPRGKYKISNTLGVYDKNKLVVVSDNAEIIITQTSTTGIYFSNCKNLHAFIGHITISTTSSASSATKIAILIGASTVSSACPDICNITILGAFQYGLYMYQNYIGYTNGSLFNFTMDGENTGVNGILLTDACQYFEIINCKICNLTGTGILIKGANNIITGGNITNCRIGIWVDSSSGGNLDHGLINGTTCNHNRACGIFLKSLVFNYHILNCKIWANNGPDNLTDAVNIGARSFHYGIYLEKVKGLVMTGNTIAHNNNVEVGIDGLNTSIINNNVFRGASIAYALYEWYTAGVSSHNNQICNNTFNGTYLGVSRYYAVLMANDSCYNYMIKDNTGETLSNDLLININSGNYYIGVHNNYIINPFIVSTSDSANPDSQTANIYILPHATGTKFKIYFTSIGSSSSYTWIRYKTNSNNVPNIIGTGISYYIANKSFRMTNNIRFADFTPLSNSTFTDWNVLAGN
jgi:hypothetical protein